MTNKVEICGVNTSALPVLSREEKEALFVKIQEGDAEARKTFIEGNLRLVLSVIQRFSNRGENPDDLFQVGCIGLLKAIDNFDITKEVELSTYAVPMIIGEIRRYLRDNAAIRVSRSLRDLAYKALGVKEKFMRENDREPTVDEIAEALGEKKENVTEALEAIVDPVSLYDPVYNDGTDCIYVMDQISDEGSSDEAWLEDIALREALCKLSARERAIIEARYYRGKTQMEIAAEIGISQAQVSRLEKGALESIRKYI